MIFTNVLVLFVFLQGAAPTSSTDESPRLDPEIERRMLLDARTGAARPPLLPEGAFLTAVRGRVGFDDSVGAWTLSTGRDEGDVRVFGLLPSRSLGDMLRIIDVAGERTDFEVTGRVLVYDGMNFLLPSFGARLTDPTVPGIPADGALEAVSTDPDATPNSLAIEDAGVADRLEARLRNRIESLPTSSDTGDVHVESIGTLGEGTRIQNRRGAIVRDQRTGTWRFVFDARGSGPTDPAMELLPCLLLERLQRAAAASELPPAVLISGELTSFGGRNYLLPTLWRPAASGRNLVP